MADEINQGQPHGTTTDDRTGRTGTWGTTNDGLGPNAPWPAKLADHAMSLVKSLGMTNSLLAGIVGCCLYFLYLVAPPVVSFLVASRDSTIAQTEIHRTMDVTLLTLSKNQESMIALQQQALKNHDKILEMESQMVRELGVQKRRIDDQKEHPKPN
jgi:hypothetical protein